MCWENASLKLRYLVWLNFLSSIFLWTVLIHLLLLPHGKESTFKGSSLILFSLFFLCFLSFPFGLNFRERSLFLISQYLSLQFKVLRWKTNCFHSTLSYSLRSKLSREEAYCYLPNHCCPVDECQTSHFDWRTESTPISQVHMANYSNNIPLGQIHSELWFKLDWNAHSCLRPLTI